MSPNRSIIVLAAGASRRLGRPKQLLSCGGEPLIRRAANTAIRSGLGAVYVVLATGDADSRTTLQGLPIQVVANPTAERGIGTSIRAAIAHLPAETDEAVIMLVDQPAVTPRVLADLAAALRTDSLAAGCEYGGTIGVPAIFRRELFDELLRLDDDSGARSILRRHRDRVATIPFPGGELDVDTAADAERLGLSRLPIRLENPLDDV